MDELADREKDKYEKMWDVQSYRAVSPGYVALDDFFDFFKEEIKEGQSFTDFGCGMGITSGPLLREGLTVQLVDIADNCLEDSVQNALFLHQGLLTFTQATLWNLPSEVEETDWIYCMDVLEHIPPNRVDETLSELASRCKRGGVLQVFLDEEPFGDIIHETLHLTLKSQDWWTESIKKHFQIEATAPIIEDVRISYFVRPKKPQS